MKKIFRHTKHTILVVSMKVFSLIPVVGSVAKKRASHIHFRREPVKFFGLHGFEWLSFLFLTDPHIGGSIDAIAGETAHGIWKLLTGISRENTVVLHGGDFISSDGHPKRLSFENFVTVAQKLFTHLTGLKHFAVVGNHDEENPEFVYARRWLEEKMQVHFMTEPRHAKRIFIHDKSICIHGLHTLAQHLHKMPKKERDMLMDQYIYMFNHTHNDMNVVLLHSPDGLEFILRRLITTKQTITTPTLFLAGHTHGASLDFHVLRELSSLVSSTRFHRYKGWYFPEGKYAHTGNWKMYVSTGMGNSPGCDVRLNADPEVVLFTL